MKKLRDVYMKGVEFASDTHMYCSFGHLNDYSSRYYCYLWSRVFAADIFAVLKEQGLNNAFVGKFYVDTVLAPGGSKDPYEILRSFLGRNPRVSTFFESMGMGKKEQSKSIPNQLIP